VAVEIHVRVSYRQDRAIFNNKVSMQIASPFTALLLRLKTGAWCCWHMNASARLNLVLPPKRLDALMRCWVNRFMICVWRR
jgi:hypothetical protein